MFLIKFTWKLIKWIIIIAFIIALIPIIFLGIMYKNEEPNINDYQDPETLNFTETLSESLNTFLISENNDDLTFSLNQKSINQTVKDLIVKQAEKDNSFNKDYMNKDASKEDRKYAIKNDNGIFVGVKGLWVNFSEDGMSIITSADVKYGFITYKTSIRIKLTLEETEQAFIIKVDSVKAGHLPVVWMYNLTKWGMLEFGKEDLGETIKKALPIGTFDADARTLTIQKEEYTKLLDSALDTDANPMAKNLVNLIQALDLFKFSLLDSKLNFDVKLKKLEQTLNIDDSKYTKITTEQQLKSIITTQLNSVLFSALDTTDTTLNLDINEVQLNQIMNYYLSDKVIFSKEIEIGGKTFIIETKPIVSLLRENNTIISIRISIKNKDVANSEFIAELAINTLPSIGENGKDLHFKINDIKIGEVNFEVGNETRTKLMTTIETLLSESEDVTFLNETIILKDFTEKFVQAGIKVKQIESLDEKLRFKIEPQNPEVTKVIEEVKKEIASTLETIKNTKDEFKDIPSELTAETVSQYVNSLEQVEQEKLYGLLTEELQKNPEINLDEIFAIINQN
ncbi:conserved hypothetical protein [Alteracholeplasma palmae J233]|uniref:Uncharacterized protein n=1 Tax=Alteracholeplasma palmae (strain ATCC 49389 / J233) TaxID=1318466 RepID=U4KJL1_ALTPJ|nr:hypothetical protein [Alteracholeplasma palmae]CCV63699.1 conserved hypothetical protein [Alteracholeplasma palmae J233]